MDYLFLVNFPIKDSTRYLCSKAEAYGSPINVSDGCLVYTWSNMAIVASLAFSIIFVFHIFFVTNISLF